MHVLIEQQGIRVITKAQRGPEMPPEITNWLDRGGPFPEELAVSVYGQGEIKLEILDRDENGFIAPLRSTRRGKKGFVVRVRNAVTQQTMAAKLTIPEDFDEGTSPLTELDHSTKLRSGEKFIHLLQGVGRVKRLSTEPQTSEQRPWVCFLSDWLEGKTLQEYIAEDRSIITPTLVAEIAETLVRAVLFLERNGLKHDDLHLGNLMLVPTDPILCDIDPLEPPYRLVVIDLGSVKPIERRTFKRDDDWSSIARCLVQLHNVLHADRRIASRYSVFLRRLAEFIENLADEDLARHFPEPTDYLRRIRELSNTLSVPPQHTQRFNPFDAISAEHLANDELLLDLFVDYLPWFSMVKTDEPSVLVGPRGCGKSMVFRYLCMRTHISNVAVPASVLDRVDVFGVYIGCSSDLGNDLLWLAREPGRPIRQAASITTYFNLVLARELLRALATCNRAINIRDALQITPTAIQSIVTFFLEQLGHGPDFVRIKGLDLLQSTSDLADRLRLGISRDLTNGVDSPVNLSPTFIRELCRFIVSAIPALQTKRITFFLDDYTSHRLSTEIQRILNAVVWQRDASFIFKVSSEPYGFDSSHVDGARIDANREFREIDAGNLTISHENAAERRKFISRLLDKRLEAAQYRGRTATLIGDSTYKNDHDLAAAIRAAKRGNHYFYHGIHVLADAWSGDVSTVLHMLREMFVKANVGSATENLISHKDQHQSIVRVSKALTERVRTYHPFGIEMHQILSNLGEVARRLLVEAPDETNRAGEPIIHRKYRLELSLNPGEDLEERLTQLGEGDQLVKIKRELVRRAILIELPKSRAKEGEGRQTNRWQIRASLLPNFGTSLTREHYIDIKRIEDLAELLTNPKLFADKVYQRYAKNSNQELFSDLGG